MKKETFIKALEAIQEQHKRDCEKAELLEKVFPESFAANLMYDNRLLQNAIIAILTEAMNDTDNFIEYFLWELDFGKKGEKLEVKTADGKRHHLTDAEELYNFLKEYYDKSTSSISLFNDKRNKAAQ